MKNSDTDNMSPASEGQPDADNQYFGRVDTARLEEIAEAERPTLSIRWSTLWVALLLCVAQSIIGLYFETHGSMSLIATQISVITFAFLFILVLVVNPLLRAMRLVRPFNRAELMTIFAALFVSAGISSFGMADVVVPMIPAPFNEMWNTPQSGRLTHLVPYLNPKLFITDPALIREFRNGFPESANILARIPWRAWIGPLSYWMIFVLAVYAMLYAVAVIFFNAWSRREKIVFPLAQLPEAALPAEGAPDGSIPPIVRNYIFWVGFMLAFLVLSFNGMCQAGILRGMDPFFLGVRNLRELLLNSVFNGIADGGTGLTFQFRFITIGIAFILPLATSLSLWGYQVIIFAVIQMAIWMAFIPTSRAIVSNMAIDSSFVSSLGAGALFAVAAAMLVKFVWDQWNETSGSEKGGSRWMRFLHGLGWGMALLIVSLLVIIGWLRWAGVDLFWGTIYVALAFLLSVGLIRVLAESGVYNQQVHAGPIHLLGMTSGPVVPASTVAPLLPAHSMFFFDMKTFIGPNIMNSFRMEEEVRAPRRRFHLFVVLGILVTIVVSIVTVMYFAYSVGANRANNWFFTTGPDSVLAHATRVARYGAGAQSSALWIFFGFGAAWAIFSLAIRRKFFWWLHPIGLVMLVNPLVRMYWVGFFLGWCCKAIAVRYGGRHTYAQLRPAFIGLIFGELTASFLWAMAKFAFALDYVRIDINP